MHSLNIMHQATSGRTQTADGCSTTEPLTVPHPKSLRSTAPSGGAAARKALAQHFLVDSEIVDRIVSAAELDPTDTVVEVGPGRGALTGRLVRMADRVIAIEVDSHLAEALAPSLGNPTNLTVVNADARDVDLATVLEGVDRYKLVANLPYYAANPILRRFLEEGPKGPSFMVVMVQAEVAARMLAEGGRMSLLAVGIQVYGVPRKVCQVPPRAFRPPPKVNSSVVRIDVRADPAIEMRDADRFFRLVRAGFFAPRKQLRNSLSLGLGISHDQAGDLLGEAGIDPMRRAETLGLEEWARLHRADMEKPPYAN